LQGQYRYESHRSRPRGRRRIESRGGEDFLSTLLDIINPLQHIPLVSNLYREITGDQISSSARILGGGLFGGPIGLTSADATETETNIHQQADAGSHAGADTDPDIVLGGPSALAALQASPVSPTAQATPISLSAPVSLAHLFPWRRR
jgi:hypothetical protein